VSKPAVLSPVIEYVSKKKKKKKKYKASRHQIKQSIRGSWKGDELTGSKLVRYAIDQLLLATNQLNDLRILWSRF
jgi:hypothetical protein